MSWYVVGSIAAVGGALWLFFSQKEVANPPQQPAPVPAAPKPPLNVKWIAGIVAQVAAHVAGVPLAIQLVRRYNPKLTTVQEELLSVALNRAIEGYAKSRPVEVHLMAALAIAVPNGADLARLASEVLASFRSTKKRNVEEPFEHPNKPSKESKRSSGTGSITDEGKRSPTDESKLSSSEQAKRSVKIHPSAPPLDPLIAPSAPPLASADPQSEDLNSLLKAMADLKSIGVDCSTFTLKSFSALWLNALLLALREKPVPSCTFTLDDLVDEKSQVIKGVAAVFQPRASHNEAPHVYLYRTSALKLWFQKSDWNPVTRESVSQRHVVEIT